MQRNQIIMEEYYREWNLTKMEEKKKVRLETLRNKREKPTYATSFMPTHHKRNLTGHKIPPNFWEWESWGSMKAVEASMQPRLELQWRHLLLVLRLTLALLIILIIMCKVKRGKCRWMLLNFVTEYYEPELKTKSFKLAHLFNGDYTKLLQNFWTWLYVISSERDPGV